MHECAKNCIKKNPRVQFLLLDHAVHKSNDANDAPSVFMHLESAVLTTLNAIETSAAAVARQVLKTYARREAA